jgi:hypothetical protein
MAATNVKKGDRYIYRVLVWTAREVGASTLAICRLLQSFHDQGSEDHGHLQSQSSGN